MKKVILRGVVLTLMVAVSAVCVAQPQRPQDGERPKQERPEREEMTPESMATKLTEKMVESLELTSAQEKKVYAANLDYAKKMMEARTLKERHEAALVEIFSADQTVKFFNMKNGGDKRGGAPRRMAPGKGDAPQMQKGAKRGMVKEGTPQRGGRRPMPAKEVESKETPAVQE